MDLFGSNAGAISNGNARMNNVRDYNNQVQQHNSDIANQISNLGDQEKTGNIVQQIKDVGSEVWTGTQMPDKVKAYNTWRANKQATNPTENESRNLTAQAEETETAPSEDWFWGQAPPEARAEGRPEGISEVEDLVTGESGESGTLLNDGLKSAEGLTEDGLSKIGAATGILGAGAVGGMDLYSDIKAGKIAGNNWEQKTANVMQIGGALADIGGTVFPPLALIGGVIDLTAGAIGEIGDLVSQHTSADNLQKTKEKETVATVSAPSLPTIVTSRVQ